MPYLPDNLFAIPPPPKEGRLSEADIWVVISPGDDNIEINSLWMSKKAAQARVAWAERYYPTSNYSVMTLEDALFELTRDCCR
jgi:hypothetical protein